MNCFQVYLSLKIFQTKMTNLTFLHHTQNEYKLLLIYRLYKIIIDDYTYLLLLLLLLLLIILFLYASYYFHNDSL